MKVVARAVKFEPLGEPYRCSEAENAKFWCLKVRLYFDDGRQTEYELMGYSEPKELENFLANKKGVQEVLLPAFGLTEDGRVVVDYEKLEQLSQKLQAQKPKRRAGKEKK
ncbi:MAG: hypothetical protein GXO03_02945 [Aquificae bacterium]|nr:hypothetical protein [Aquificota bacterium]